MHEIIWLNEDLAKRFALVDQIRATSTRSCFCSCLTIACKFKPAQSILFLVR